MTQAILTCNAGSTSLRCALFQIAPFKPILRFEANKQDPHCVIKDIEGETDVKIPQEKFDYLSQLKFFIDYISAHTEAAIIAVGHRIVHGGKIFDKPTRIDRKVRQALNALAPLAPLHQPFNLTLLETAQKLLPHTINYACFDTAFHRAQPAHAQQYALPAALVKENAIYRYGFHGLSYEYIAGILPEYMERAENKRVIIAHLGGGAGACALRDGQSVAATTGFTALDGMMMATRCGDLDPGVILYLLQTKNMAAKEIETLLYQKSGLLGVSDLSGDMRVLLNSDRPEAAQAVELFCLTAAKQISALLPFTQGTDALIFTGAIGKNAPAIRQKICDYLGFTGLKSDTDKNNRNIATFSSQESRLQLLCLETNEEEIIARHGISLLQGG